MQLIQTLTYPQATVDQVAAMLRDPAFREAVCAAEKHLIAAEVSVNGDAVVVDQRQSADRIPGFAKKFVGPEMRIVQTEQWHGVDSGDVEVTIPGKPGRITGTNALRQDADAVTRTVTLDIEVNIPLVGKKIAALIGEKLESSLRSEERVARRWLAER